MLRVYARPLGLLLCACLFVSLAFAQETRPALEKSEAEKWREDLRHMAAEMEARHKNLFHTMTREQFERAIQSLHERIPNLARHQIIVEMARIAALVGDGHTNVNPARDPKAAFRTLPVKLYLFKDGLFVRSARREQAGLVGARVVRIGGATADEAVTRAREIIGRDNEMGVRFLAPVLLSMPEVLHALGLAASVESADFTLETAGRQRVVTLGPHGPAEMLPADTDTTWMNQDGWVDMRDAAQSPTPLWLREPRNKFRYEYLPESRTLYVQLNEVGNKKEESLADFSKRVFEFVEANPVERMVLDLRLNRGGNGELVRPFVVGVIKSKLNQPGRFFTLIGRGTWSAAQFLIDHLERWSNPIFVGEPSASKGNTYGDSRRITLPHSGLTVRVSVYYWQMWAPWDTRHWTAPHLTAELSSADYRANLDPALAAVLGYTPRKFLTELLDGALTEGGIESALKRYRAFKADPVNKYASTEEPLLITGQRLLNENRPEHALLLFNLVREEHPHSWRGYFATGEALFRSGNKEQAARQFERALEINPKAYEVRERLREARRR